MAVIPGTPIKVPEGCIIGITHAVDSYGGLYRLHPVGFMKRDAMETDRELEKKEWDFVVGNGIALPEESYTLESEHGNTHGFWLPVNLSREDERVMHPLRVYAVPRGWLESSEMLDKAPRSRDFV
jgi:hypothetical protein